DEAEQARAEGPLEVGQGDDQRAGVRRGEQHPGALARQCPPLVVGMVGVAAGASPDRGRSRCGTIHALDLNVNVRFEREEALTCASRTTPAPRSCPQVWR